MVHGKRWHPPKKDFTLPDAKPRCRQCRELATFGGRYVSQEGSSVVRAWGRWVTVWMCEAHVLSVRDRFGVMDIASIVPGKRPRKKVGEDQIRWDF